MPSLDLRPQLGTARNQGSRPTCIAFAVSDGHAAARGSREPLSVEHLYFNAVQRTLERNPDAGVNMPTCCAALALDGQCPEVGWAYTDPMAPSSSWHPPATATPSFRRSLNTSSASIAAVTAELDAGRPVVIALLLGERFYAPDPAGRIMPGPNDNDANYHAVLAVGHGLDGSEFFFLVRNSWGNEWGLEGHSWLSAAYLTPRLYAVACFPSRGMI